MGRARFWLALALVVVGAVVWTGTGYAAPPAVPTFPDACGGANNPDPAVCERLDFLATTGVAVYTSSDDSHRLDLIWWGVWADVGVAFLLLIAPAWWRAWGYETKLGRG